ncbi:DUF3500 domain-containing protein [Microbacterium sp. NPDC096154]|uniref:DUF3500 domain-containing protein n=1 Tax=Microbacterium sp. NPDC096154 TaxID=3155549 RepID=UPI00331AF2FD
MTQGEDIDGFFTTARTSGRDEAVTLETEDFRDYLYPLDSEELAPWRDMTYERFTAERRGHPFLEQLLEDWDALYEAPFVGVTSDGVPREGLYPLPEGCSNDAGTVAAARTLLDALNRSQRERILLPIDAPDWRGWSNPEFVFHRHGIRLEDMAQRQLDAFFVLLDASLSADGAARVREGMALNGYLGELTGLPNVLNSRSFALTIFGEPSTETPWGWQLFGHHVCVNFVAVGGREVVAPVFLGGEPALTDTRPPLFDARERLALELASSLTAEQREKAVVYDSVLDPSMPEGRLHPADERHLAGAFHDNWVIPYEGVRASELDERQRGILRAIVEDFHLLLRDEQRAMTMAEYDAHLDETYFAWYGATDGSQPVYFRIQSPVLVAELDNHAGVWLANKLPARFHVHTTLRLPNGNDYGKAYLAQWRESRGE